MCVQPIVPHASSLVTQCADALAASGSMPIHDGKLFSSESVLSGYGKIIDLMANKNELTIDLSSVQVALMHSRHELQLWPF